MTGASGHAKACLRRLLAGAALLLAGAHAATPPGAAITNAATGSFRISGVAVTVNAAATVTTSNGTPASVQLLAYQAGASRGVGARRERTVTLPPVQCSRNGAFATLPAPVVPGVGGRRPCLDPDARSRHHVRERRRGVRAGHRTTTRTGTRTWPRP
jgi:hypothetical protein